MLLDLIACAGAFCWTQTETIFTSISATWWTLRLLLRLVSQSCVSARAVLLHRPAAATIMIEPRIETAEPMHFAGGNCIISDVPNAVGPVKKIKRRKRKIKKVNQQEEDALVQQVEERFEALNCLVCEGSITQEMLVQIRSNAVVELNEIDMQACDLLII